MARWWGVLLAALAFGLVACGSSDGSGPAGEVKAEAGDEQDQDSLDWDTDKDAPRPDGEGISPTDAQGDQAQPPDVHPDAPWTDTTGQDTQPGETVTEPCDQEFATRCADLHLLEWCFNGYWGTKAVCQNGWICVEGACVEEVPCTPGSVGGCDDDMKKLVCSPSGNYYLHEACPGTQNCVNGQCGDFKCAPGNTKCQDDVVLLKCKEDGSDWEYSKDCDEGTVCVNANCVSGCDAAIKNASYIGCEYYTVDLDQYADPFGDPRPVPHTVVIANPGVSQAMISFKPYDASVTVTVPEPWVDPGQAKAFQMPRWDIDDTGIFGRSIRIVSSQPVLAVQFNPFNNSQVYSNDASLLLPTGALGKEYWILSWPSSPLDMIDIPGMSYPSQQGYFTVVATEPGDTQVTVKVTGYVDGTPAAIPGVIPLVDMSPGDEQMFLMHQGQVLNMVAHKKKPYGFAEANMFDLTGSRITADKPIMVFGGHEEAVVGWNDPNLPQGTEQDACCAEHMEEQLFPVDTWGMDLVCAKSRPRGPAGNHEPDVWRILAAYPGTILTTVPAINGVNGKTLNGGEWIQFEAMDSFEVHASKPIEIGQYTVGNACTQDFIGDPDFILAVPSAQYRENYPIAVPEGYGENYITLVRAPGAAVKVDQAPVADSVFAAIPGGSWEVGYVTMASGQHLVESSQPIAVYAFGQDSAVSYGYPAGLNLKKNNPLTPGQ